jgi:hypothetical protein
LLYGSAIRLCHWQFCVVVISAASGETISASWQTVTQLVTEDGRTVTREGIAEFANGEKAHYRLEAMLGPQSSWAGGTSAADAVYRFDGGSSFTMRLVLIWNSVRQVGGGLFRDGGRVALLELVGVPRGLATAYPKCFGAGRMTYLNR